MVHLMLLSTNFYSILFTVIEVHFDDSSMNACVIETSVPGKPTSLRIRPLTTSIVVSWTPPVEQDIMIRGYVLGYGIGIPDVYRQIVPSRQRYYAVKSLREPIFIFLRAHICAYH